MPKEKMNHSYKDALFKIVFGDYRENALSLYNAINGTEYTNVDDLEITTLKDALYIGIKNDVSFLFNNDMNLYEQQSTYCPNMPLRGLGYFTDLYRILLGGKNIARERIYSSTRLKIPTPKYYVFYNGGGDRPDSEELHLSDLYSGEGDMEITAHMLNVNAGHNLDLLGRCKPLSDYSELVNRLRENSRAHGSLEDAVRVTIDSCIDDGILADILRKERARIMNILYSGLTQEQVERLHKWEVEQGREEGREEGRVEGREEGRFESVDKLIAGGYFDEKEACEAIGVNIDAYKEYLEGKSKE